jgi:hypothetical protein
VFEERAFPGVGGLVEIAPGTHRAGGGPGR